MVYLHIVLSILPYEYARKHNNRVFNKYVKQICFYQLENDVCERAYL